ncbi:MAG: response regulator [Spirochaetes bacterium]|nr:response regulator [Spirochaetota bacterium]
MATILLADDLAFIKMVQKEILQKEGYDIIGEAADGLEVIEKYKKLRPDVVIMDITMPKMDGLNALKAIRQLDPDARVIVCSALGQQQLIIEAIKIGAKDFIVKPFDPPRLATAIQKALK